MVLPTAVLVLWPKDSLNSENVEKFHRSAQESVLQ